MKLKEVFPTPTLLHALLFHLILLTLLPGGLCSENYKIMSTLVKKNNSKEAIVSVTEVDSLESTTTEYSAPITQIDIELEIGEVEDDDEQDSFTARTITPGGATNWKNGPSGYYSQPSFDSYLNSSTFTPFQQQPTLSPFSLTAPISISMETGDQDWGVERQEDEPVTLQPHPQTNSLPESPPPLPPPFHQTFFKESSTMNLTLNQKQVISELNQLWLYSESLNDSDHDDFALKGSLSSVVQLVHARVLSEPDKTLHRLRSLLAKLRERILPLLSPPPSSTRSQEGRETGVDGKIGDEKEEGNPESSRSSTSAGKTIREEEDGDQGEDDRLEGAKSRVKLPREHETVSAEQDQDAGLNKGNGEEIENPPGTIQSTQGRRGLTRYFEEGSKLDSDFTDYMTTTLSSEGFSEKNERLVGREKRDTKTFSMGADGIGEIEQIFISSLENSLQYYPENLDVVGGGVRDNSVEGAINLENQINPAFQTNANPSMHSTFERNSSTAANLKQANYYNSDEKSGENTSKFVLFGSDSKSNFTHDSTLRENVHHSSSGESLENKHGQNKKSGDIFKWNSGQSSTVGETGNVNIRGFENSRNKSRESLIKPHDSSGVIQIKSVGKLHSGRLSPNISTPKSNGFSFSRPDKTSLRKQKQPQSSTESETHNPEVDMESERYFSQTMRTLILGTATPPAEKMIQKIITVEDAPSTSYVVSSDQSVTSSDFEKFTKYPLSPFLKVPLVLPYPVSGILQRPAISQFLEKNPQGIPSISLQSSSDFSKPEFQPQAEILPGQAAPISATTSHPVPEIVSVDQIANAIAQLLYPTISSFQLSNSQTHSHIRPDVVTQTNPEDYQHKLELLQNISGNKIPPGGGSNQIHSFLPPNPPTSQPGLYPALLQAHPLPDFLSKLPAGSSTTTTTKSPPPQIQTPKPTLSTSPLIQFLLDNLDKPTGNSDKDSSPGSHSNFSANLTLLYKHPKPNEQPAPIPQIKKPQLLQILSPFTIQSSSPIPVSVPTNLKSGVQQEQSQGDVVTNRPETAPNSTTGVSVVLSSSTVPVLQIIGELQESNIMQAPAAFLNGTRDGFVQFVSTLGTLSFTTKMVMVLGLSVAVLSIVLGVYSMGPPIIAVGILGIMIPIGILLLLQDSNSRNKNKKIYVVNPKAKFNMDELKDTFAIVLRVIDEAYAKYKEDETFSKLRPQDVPAFRD